jgi:predicted glycoside hydrolase/deacetylase ChbG (UPF0249 family)
VTADDFGIGRETSRGIIRAHLDGPVTATSMMVVTGDHARASLDLLEQAPRLEVGLHLVLTRCGHAPLKAKKNSGFTDRDGNFLHNGGLWRAAFTGRVSKAAVANELGAQAEQFASLTGRRPAYFDCHHHAHQLPVIRQAIVELVEQGVLPPIGRTTVEPPAVRRNVRGVAWKRRAANFIGRRAAKLFAGHHVFANEYFVGMLSEADLAKEFPWQNFLENLPPSGVIEWIVHPGLADETLAGRDDYRAARQSELTALTNPAHWQHLRPVLSTKTRLAATARA